MMRDGLRIETDRTPEVRKQAIGIIDRFTFCRVRAIEQHSAGTKKRLNEMIDVAQRFPDDMSDFAFATEPDKRRLHGLHSSCSCFGGVGLGMNRSGWR